MSLNTFDNTGYQAERKQARERSLQLMERAADTVGDDHLNEIDFTSDNISIATGGSSSSSHRNKSLKRAQMIMDKISSHSMSGDHRGSNEEMYNLAPQGNGRSSDAMLLAEGRQHLGGRHGGCCGRPFYFVADCSKRRVLVLIAMLLVPTLIITFFATTLTKDNDAKAPQVAIMDGQILYMERYNSIRANILQSGFSKQDKLDDITSAQNKALHWLSDYDEAVMDTDHIALLQRYALATFFFSTYITEASGSDLGSSWTRGDHWMSGKGICMWYGVTCPPRLFEGRDTNHYNDNADVLSLNLTANAIQGTIPDEVVALENLLKLDLGRNELMGTIPAALGDLLDLANLYLIENDLTGTLPEELGNCENMRNMHVGGNQLSGIIPESYSDFKYLESFGVDENYFEGPLPNFYKSEGSMLILYLDENMFEGEIPASYGDMPNLFDLRVAKNKLTGKIPPELAYLKHLEILYLDENKFSGTIPDIFSDMDRLEELQLYKNELTGSIPPTLVELEALRVLYIDSNKLTGTIPETIGLLDDLTTLYMYSNKLTGSIPETIGAMKNLMDFQIYSNRLTGKIPDELGQCFRLETVYIEDNLFTGYIPATLGELDHLKSFRFYQNRFQGEVPEEVCQLTSYHRLDFIAGDCGEDQGTIDCPCCDECYP